MTPLEAAETAASRYTLPWLGSIAWPWILAVVAMVVLGVGTSGLYFGSLIEHGRNAKVLLEIKDAHIKALDARAKLYTDARARGDEIADRFDGSLRGLRIENRTFNTTVRQETEKQIYIDCKLPESGIALLRRRIESANASIVKVSQ